MPKRPHRSGLTGAELFQTVVAIEALLKKGRLEQKADPKGDTEGDVADEVELSQLESVLQMLKSKADGARPTDQDQLEKMNFFLSDILRLKPDTASRLAEKDTLGADGLWSLDMLFRHLVFLDGLVPRNNEAACRLWINAFFYRVAAMKPSGSNVVLNVEQYVPSVTLSDKSLHTVSGAIDWTVIATSPETFDRFMLHPLLRTLNQKDHALFVSEAKGPDQILRNHIPQAIVEMAGCARSIQKTTIRGVLTNGYDWIFLILTLNQDGGGTYLESDKIVTHTLQNFEQVISKESVSLITAILAHWVMHSHEPLNASEDYFKRRSDRH